MPRGFTDFEANVNEIIENNLAVPILRRPMDNK